MVVLPSNAIRPEFRINGAIKVVSPVDTKIVESEKMAAD